MELGNAIQYIESLLGLEPTLQTMRVYENRVPRIKVLLINPHKQEILDVTLPLGRACKLRLSKSGEWILRSDEGDIINAVRKQFGSCRQIYTRRI